MSQRNAQVAATILQQLGGPMFVRMTGARNMVSVDDSLKIALPSRFAKDGVNQVIVHLNGLDLYDVTFNRVGPAPSLKRILRGVDPRPTVTEVCARVDVHVEDLRSLFTEVTGLDTSLGRSR